TEEVHLFLAPITVKHLGLRVGVKNAESHEFYWSSDPSGTSRLSQEQCDSLGIPRLEYVSMRGISSWHEYHYTAIRDFFQSRGFDP
ncbi:hypothetical protein C8J57DRAFT_1004447, partial [Mycena rebaudengoi]